MTALLEVRDLVTELGTVRAVDGVSFELAARGTLGVVGESGSGKSTLALSIMRLAGGRTSGAIAFAGKDVLALSSEEMRALRGDRIAMIFQEPMTSLDPVQTVGTQVAEALVVHGRASWREARLAAIDLFRRVGIPAPEDRVRAYPHQLSGGMRQRVMIAMALANQPDLLIADEPTTALDVTVQAQILELLAALRAELGMAMLLITHDLAVVAEACDEVIVMYAGRVVERAPTAELLARPRHPYTAGLLRARESLEEIPGPSASEASTTSVQASASRADRKPTERLPGCAFAPRCTSAQARCHAEAPELVSLGASQARCHFPLEPA